MRAIIVGSGIGGLATAIRLRKKGFDVDVFEANAYAGGKLTTFEQHGYRFDAGPSLLTLPRLIDELFELHELDPRTFFNYQQLAATCHYFYDDGTMLIAHAEREKLVAEIEQKIGVSPAVVNQYLDERKFIYQTAASIFLENSLHRWQTWFSKKVIDALRSLPSLAVFTTMHQENSRALAHPKLIQLFNRYATYNGSNPYQAPGILTSIPHLEMNMGAYLPSGGMHDITKSLFALAERVGVKFHFNEAVSEILVTNKRAIGIETPVRTTYADVVVSNMDVYHTYRKLVPAQPAPEKTLKQERSSSALIFYWGIRKEFPQLDLHNIFFTADYKAEFDSIFQSKTIYSDPTIYVNITSKYCAADAPTGCENWFVMINVPANDNHPWNDWVNLYRSMIIKKLGHQLNVDFNELIETERVLDPAGIEANTSSYQGSLYGTSSNNRYAAFLRHPNFSRTIDNLYFCGGSVHPGGGIPLALLSGKIVSDLIGEQF